MNFQEAVEAMKSGKSVRAKTWIEEIWISIDLSGSRFIFANGPFKGDEWKPFLNAIVDEWELAPDPLDAIASQLRSTYFGGFPPSHWELTDARSKAEWLNVAKKAKELLSK